MKKTVMMSVLSAGLTALAYSVDTGTTPTIVSDKLVSDDGGSKTGAAPLTLTNDENNFGGVFTVHNGLLKAFFGQGLAKTDRVVLDGGILAPGTATIDVTIGAQAGQVQLTGTQAGFGAYGTDAVLKVNGGTGALVYPSDNFNPTTLLLNDSFCANTLTLAQPVQAVDALTVDVGGGTAVFQAGVTAASGFTKKGAGTARFTASENSLGALTLDGGTMEFVPPDGVEASTAVEALTFSSGTMIQNGGILKVDAHSAGGADNYATRWAVKDGQTSHYYLNGGIFERVSYGGSLSLGVGTHSAAHMNVYVQANGKFIVHSPNVYIGSNSSSTGNIHVQDGGVLEADNKGNVNSDVNFCVGRLGGGSVRVSKEGRVDIAGHVNFCEQQSGYGDGHLYVMTGGTLCCRGITRDSLSDTTYHKAYVWLDGGTIEVRDDGTLKDPFFTNINGAYVGVNGTVIDTNGRDVRFEQNLEACAANNQLPDQTWVQPTTAAEIIACAAFTKKGAGTLTLDGNGSNTYQVATCVAEGTLATKKEKALPEQGLVKLTGGTLDLMQTTQNIDALAGYGTVKNGTFAANVVWPGLGTPSGTLTVESDAVLKTQKICFAASLNGDEVVCGKLVYNGTLDLTGVEIAVDDVEDLGLRSRTIIEAADITGMPTCSLKAPYHVIRHGRTLRVVADVGTAIIIR